MTRRRLLLFGLPTMLVVLGLGAWLVWPRTAITRENAAKIQKGMTRADVEAILGGPPRDEGKGNGGRSCAWIGDQPGNDTVAWVGSDTAFRADFSDDERVVGMAVGEVQQYPEPLIDMLCRWLRL